MLDSLGDDASSSQVATTDYNMRTPFSHLRPLEEVVGGINNLPTITERLRPQKFEFSLMSSRRKS